MNLTIGVDGGGSKTRAAVVDSALHVLGRGTAGPSNISSRSESEVLDAIVAAVDQALSQAGIGRNSIQQFGFGLAGVESAAARATVQHALAREFPDRLLHITTDARAALAGALVHADGAGMILIAGTGTVAFGRNRTGREARAGGYGWVVGDEGGGFWIGRLALDHVVRALDGRAPETLLSGLLQKRLGLRSIEDIVQYVYRPGMLPSVVAAVAPVVVEAVAAGDPVSRGILDRAAAEVTQLALSLVEKLNLQNERFAIAKIGGLWEAGTPFEQKLVGALRSVAPQAEVGNPAHPSEVGAARLAMHAARGGM